MNDIKKINRQFLFALISFIVIVLLAATIMVLSGILIENNDVIYMIYFAVLMAMLFVVSTYKNMLERITNTSYIIKIRANQSKPLQLNHLKNFDKMTSVLIAKGYLRFTYDNHHTLFYKISKDSIKRMLRKYMLEVVVLIHQDNDSFYLDAVDEDIHKIQQEQLKDHKKIDRMFITQIKQINELNDETRESIKEIVFVKSSVGIISTINIGCHAPSGTAVMLYSDQYSPSLYYKYHIEQIKKII